MVDRVDGLELCVQGLEIVRSRTVQSMNDKVETFCDQVLRRAKQLCPVDSGKLKESGRVIKRGGRGLQRYSIEFGTPYAVYVEFDLTKYHAPPTQAMFLTTAYQERVVQFINKVGDVLKVAFK